MMCSRGMVNGFALSIDVTADDPKGIYVVWLKCKTTGTALEKGTYNKVCVTIPCFIRKHEILLKASF